MSGTKLFVCPDDGCVCGQCKIADCVCECHAFDKLSCTEIVDLICACHKSARASTFNGMTRNKIMEWMHGRRDPMKFVEAAEEISRSRKKSLIDSSLSYQKNTGGSKVAAVTSHVGVMTPEMHQLFKTLWKDSKAKGNPTKLGVNMNPTASMKGSMCAMNACAITCLFCDGIRLARPSAFAA